MIGWIVAPSLGWFLDPLPVAPAGVAPGSMAWWRWWSAEVLKARRATW